MIKKFAELICDRVSVKSIKDVGGYRGVNEALPLFLSWIHSEDLFDKNEIFTIINVISRKKKIYAILGQFQKSQDEFITPLSNICQH